ncbi:hypothetical protein RKD49_004619 [Streptomyces glaucescens]
MSRLSREKQPEQQRSSAPLATPIDVRVLADAEPGTDRVTVGGTPLTPAPGEEPQQAVLNHLHRIALATGRPVLATIHDERIGYVVPLQVSPDGSSSFTGRPASTASASAAPSDAAPASAAPASAAPANVAPASAVPASAAPASCVPTGAAPASAAPPGGAPADVTPPGVTPDGATKVLRLPSKPGRQPQTTSDPSPNVTPGSAPTFRLRAVPEHAVAPSHAPGTVAPPTGAFGPPPVMAPDVLPRPDDTPPRSTPPAASTGAAPLSAQAPAPGTTSAPRPRLVPDPSPSSSSPDPKPTPPRGFDAVAEAVLGDDNTVEQSVAPTPLTAPLARISEAVKEGRIDAASGLAEEALRDGASMLGQDHPEVLRLGELAAYVAYLAGDPVRAFRRSVELVHARRRTGDAEGAYGNVQSAATAWRAVRDPLLGLELGRQLIALWTELVAEPGPAAEDTEELESAHARMTRLADRAARRSGD